MSQKVNVVNLAARMTKMIPTENWPDTVNGYFEFESKFFSFLHTLDTEDRLELIFQMFYKGKLDPETIKKNVIGARTIVLIESTGDEGKIECNLCDGEGRLDCPRCDSGYDECDDCDGLGSYECDTCNGTGEEGEEECSICDGSGEIYCNYCDGDGRTDCTDCSGRGDIECDDCNGDGYIEKPNETMCRVTIAVSFDRDLNRKLLNYQGKVLPGELVGKVLKSFVVTTKTLSINLNPNEEMFPNDKTVLVGVLSDPFDVYETVLYIPTFRYPDEEIKATAEDHIKRL